MHNIMQALHEDHINVARLLEVIENVLERAHAGDLNDLSLAHSAMRYMTAYPDIYHHPAEDILFARLLKRAPETAAVITSLSAEHDSIGKAGGQFLKILQTTIKTPVETPELLITGPQYVIQLREHMNIEESKIFPIINVVFSQHDWSILEESIVRAADPIFGRQVQKSYQDLARLVVEKAGQNRS